MTMATAMGSRRATSLEELVGRLVDAVRWESAPAQSPGLARSIHEARRLRKAGDLDGALAVLANADTGRAREPEGRWAHPEWMGLVCSRFGDAGVLVYSPSSGRAAALTPKVDGVLEVVAVLGMGWQPGKLVSRRSLRGLRPLNGGSGHSTQGKGQGPPGRLPLPRRGRGQLHGLRRHPAVSLLRLRGHRRCAGLRAAYGGRESP